MDSAAAPLELALMATRSRHGLRLSIRYDADLYTAQTTRRYLAHLELVLSSMAAGSTQRIDDLPLLTAQDQADLDQWGGRWAVRAEDPPPLGAIHPGDSGKPAIVDGDATWTRKKLDEAADAIAARLIGQGVGRGNVVAITLPRSPAFVAAVLGVARSGAAYLPLDPAQPDRRLVTMIADAAPAAIVRADSEPSAVGADIPQISVSAAIAAVPPVPAPSLQADDLLCLLYTSGSTGSPKAVALEHGNLSALLAVCRKEVSLESGDRIAWYSSVSFDLSHLELWSAIIASAELHVVPEALRLDPAGLACWLVECRITVAWLPTAMGEAMVQQPWPPQARLRWLGVGGEQLNIRPPHELPFTLMNIYGPTECTVYCTRSPVSPGDQGPPPIGTPVPGTRVETRAPDGRLLRPAPSANCTSADRR